MCRTIHGSKFCFILYHQQSQLCSWRPLSLLFFTCLPIVLLPGSGELQREVGKEAEECPLSPGLWLCICCVPLFVFSPLRFWRWTVGHIGWRWFLLEMSHLPQWDASPFSKPTLVKSVGIHHGVDFCSLSLEWAQGGRWFLQNQNFRSAWLWLLWPENPSKVSVYCSSSTVYTFTVVPTDSDAEKSGFSPNPNLLTYVHYLILDFFDLK